MKTYATLRVKVWRCFAAPSRRTSGGVLQDAAPVTHARGAQNGLLEQELELREVDGVLPPYVCYSAYIGRTHDVENKYYSNM